jgi:O-antigen/teichoic acid export membrane protein
VFAGWYYHFNYGIFLTKKTIYATWIWAGGAMVNLALNYFLIKAFHGLGASMATSLSFMVISAVTFVISQRLYPIPFEFGRVGKLALAAVPVYLGARLVPAMTPFAAIPIKLAVLSVYPVLLYVTGFFRKEELDGMAAILAKARDIPATAIAKLRAGEGK